MYLDEKTYLVVRITFNLETLEGEFDCEAIRKATQGVAYEYRGEVASALGSSDLQVGDVSCIG